MSFDLHSYADINRLVRDKEYAKKKYIIVKSINTNKLSQLEKQLIDISSTDPEWRDKVLGLKRQISELKSLGKTKSHYLLKYNKNYLNADNIETLGMFRSVVTDGNTILSIAPSKSVSMDRLSSVSIL